MLNFYQR